MRLSCLSCLFVLLLPLFGQAQDDTSALQPIVPRNRLAYGATYQSLLHFQGRPLGDGDYAVMPVLLYYNKKGWWVGYGGNYWRAESKKWAKDDLLAGYAFNINNRLSAVVYYEHWFNYNGTRTERRTLTDYFGGELDYDWNWIETNLSAAYVTGLKQARILELTFAETYGYIPAYGAREWDVRPELTFSWGSNSAAVQARTPSTVEERRFRLMAIEASVLASIRLKNGLLSASAHYILPQNPAPSEGSLKPFFYARLAMEWWIWLK